MKKILTRQWSFFWAGVGFGLAQIIYMIAGYIYSLEQGKDLVSNPITVTTNLGGMFPRHRSLLVGRPDLWAGKRPVCAARSR